MPETLSPEVTDSGGAGVTLPSGSSDSIKTSIQDENSGLNDGFGGVQGGISDSSGDIGSGPVDAGVDVHILDDAPAPRGTSEYYEWFGNQSRENQIKIEQELNEGYIPPKYREGYVSPEEKSVGDKSASDKSREGDPGAFTQDDFNKMDPNWRSRIETMQSIIDQYSQYDTEQLKSAVDFINNDPLIQRRLEEIKNEGPITLPIEVSKKFDAMNYFGKDDLEHLEVLTDKGREKVIGSLQDAFDDGYRIAELSGKYAIHAANVTNQRLTKFTGELNQLVSENDNLQPKEKNTPFSSPEHPLHDYVLWAAKVGDDWLDSHGHKAGYAAYLAETGNLNKAFSDIEKRTRTKFIENLTKAERDVARTARGGSPANQQNQGKIWKGVNLDQYSGDLNYRQKVFEGADYETRRGLEKFITSGIVPK